MFSTPAMRTVGSILIAAFALALVLTPTEARAQWHQREEDLPGMVSDQTMLTIAIVGGVLLTVLVVVIVVKAKHKDADKEQPVEPDSTKATSFMQNGSYRVGSSCFAASSSLSSIDATVVDNHRAVSTDYKVEPVCILKRDGLALGVRINF